MSKQAVRNLLRWGGIVIALIGFAIGRTAHTSSGFQIARVLMWVGLGMIVAGMIVRMFIREP